jgi:hypothetical protein
MRYPETGAWRVGLYLVACLRARSISRVPAASVQRAARDARCHTEILSELPLVTDFGVVTTPTRHVTAAHCTTPVERTDDESHTISTMQR